MGEKKVIVAPGVTTGPCTGGSCPGTAGSENVDPHECTDVSRLLCSPRLCDQYRLSLPDNKRKTTEDTDLTSALPSSKPSVDPGDQCLDI